MRLGKWSLVALAAGVALVAQAAPKKSKAPDEESLPAPARAVVLPTMQNHRVDMERLLRAVVLLDRETATALAKELSGGVRLARPLQEDATELNSLVPPGFFERQEEFEAAARRFAERAPKATDEQLGAEFGALVKTCIACHSAYLQPVRR